MTSPPCGSAHPLLGVQVDLSVEQLVVVVVVEIPLGHHFFYGSAVSHNALRVTIKGKLMEALKNP